MLEPVAIGQSHAKSDKKHTVTTAQPAFSWQNQVGHLLSPGKSNLTQNPDISIYQISKNDHESAKKIWKYVESRVAAPGLSTKWIWVDTWLKYFGSVVDYWFLVGVEAGEPCGVMLITRETHRPLPLPVHALHIGTSGEPYNENVQVPGNTFLAIENKKQVFLEAALSALVNLPSWEELVLDEYSVSEAAQFASVCKAKKLQVKTLTEQCRYFNLEQIRSDKTDILSVLNYDTRYAIRRSIKALGNDLTLEWAETPEQAVAIMQELSELYGKMWTKLGRRNLLGLSRVASFYNDVITSLFADGAIVLLRVKSKQHGTLGCLYLLNDNGMAYGCQAGWRDVEELDIQNFNKKRLKIGYVVHYLAMQESLRRGINGYNFATGEYQYKKELTTNISEITSVSIRRSIKPFVRDQIFNLYTSLDAQKKSSLLLRVFRKAVVSSLQKSTN